MIYAQFYRPAYFHVSGQDKLVEAVGDRSVIIIDGRLNPETMRRIAISECVKRGFTAWQIFKGDSFTRSHPHPQHPNTPTLVNQLHLA